MPLHRKQIRHFHEPGDLHELTFSCYRQFPLLTNNAWRRSLAHSIDAAMEQVQMQLVAFVFMPEHVHLLVMPLTDAPRIDQLLSAIKLPTSIQARRDLERNASRLLRKLTVQERPGKTAFRFWQEGPGYDRNLQSEEAVIAAIDYIHLNPVRRGFVRQAVTWRWSSARWYSSDGQHVDSDLPRLHRLPPEFFQHTI